MHILRFSNGCHAIKCRPAKHKILKQSKRGQNKEEKNSDEECEKKKQEMNDDARTTTTTTTRTPIGAI